MIFDASGLRGIAMRNDIKKIQRFLSCRSYGLFGDNKTPNITTISGCNIGCRLCKCLIVKLICGKTGIRTLGTRKGTTVFETVPIDRSGIFPWRFCEAKLRILIK